MSPSSPHGAPMLRLRGLSKSFGGVHAVKDVSFDVAAGSITSVIGPNGAGKTSLFNLISRVYPASAGSVEFDGLDLTACPTHEIARRGLSRTFQNLALFRQESVLENILVGCHARMRTSVAAACLFLPSARRAEAAAHARAEEIIDLLDLSAARHTRVGTLSYGMQKRVELGRALAVAPKLLLVDELVSGMNREETAEVARLIQHVRAALRITVVMIEHDMGIVMDISDRVVVLNFGHKIAEGTPAEVSADPAVVAAYLGQPA